MIALKMARETFYQDALRSNYKSLTSYKNLIKDEVHIGVKLFTAIFSAIVYCVYFQERSATRKRKKIVNEIIESERSYQGHLQLLISVRKLITLFLSTSLDYILQSAFKNHQFLTLNLRIL